MSNCNQVTSNSNALQTTTEVLQRTFLKRPCCQQFLNEAVTDTSLLKSALRQSLSCRINVKFAVLFGFGLNFSAVYILRKSIFP